MGSDLLSAISGKFSTSLILGTFFPVTVFVFLAQLLWVPLLPEGLHAVLASPLSGLDDKWELLVLTLFTVVLSGLLYNLNIPLIRLYEGYPWRETWVGRKKTARYRAELQTLLAKKEGAAQLVTELNAEGETLLKGAATRSQGEQRVAWARAVEAGQGDVLRAILLMYPREPLVLPTQLGNMIRSFESYPYRQYGMSAIPLWPRLIAVLEPSYAQAIDGAKSSFDFMLNSATLAGLLALLLLTTGLIYPVPLVSTDSAMAWVAQIALLGALAAWFYGQAVGRAKAWGDLVRGAFDLYRGKLLEKLGYTQVPKTAKAERALWKKISSRLSADSPPGWEHPPYADPAPPNPCRCEPHAGLVLTRGVVPVPAERALEVMLEVRNPAASDKPPENGVVVIDTVPEGFDLFWGSQRTSEGTVEVEGINPYRFRLPEPLKPQTRRQITYRIVPRPTGDMPGDGS